MQTLPDIRTLPLPSKFTTALLKLAIRTLEMAESNETGNLLVAARLCTATVGSRTTFGQLSIPSISDWNNAIMIEGIAAPSVRIHELVDLLKMIDPTTPVCDACGEFAINQIGGKFMSLAPSEVCPFCLTGHVHIVPMILRTVNWVTGELVAPNIEYDSRSHVGVGIPLTDEAIMDWAKEIHPSLTKSLEKYGVSIHGFLAYAFLYAHAFSSIEEAPEFLAHAPFHSTVNATDLAVKAAWFMDDREITNLPHKKFLSDGRRRDEFQPVVIGGRLYLIDRHIGTGDKSDVFLARTDDETPERLVLKRLRETADGDLHDHEIDVLNRLAKSVVRGSVHFSQFVPQIAFSQNSKTEKPVIAFRERGTFHFTVADVMREYPEGADFKTAVWIWKRMLMILDWVHANRLVHGAILPDHILLDVPNHNARLLDWGYAELFGGSLKAFSESNRAFYPAEVLGGSPLDPRLDIAMMTRCVIALLGGDPVRKILPSSVPDAFRVWMLEEAGYDSLRTVCDNAYALHERVSATAKQVYGPPSFHALSMPR
ncbi:hypothetical protein A3C09_04525 [Candidatus Uhrbacteria bacterium RIFCSPHIGHO2_02_FULL_47_44]|uniref:Protein kinase domain-containing protein n=1 Tax=Candidatus Uhrbacteria bacterium RIFCSPLOWO2_02_FULL_48_18 TaxID=1802408 RepID=A0A1F7VCD2_9BACT|nr:MAG: hypothetical protein A3C09_04525 [Candidatus Uhrbacteria bacterium RIFCSPHIGHO2_02_FULL_47_44]OGL77822.1 MAG: hypothetical protein A3E97_02575 [Candidatus Uhrbacteria bacterium RIFCSPHIGHO2_12_FULL_47_12]OGL80641.1 MAG: hypothetical protein A3B20_04570 [Candidatus Uhrbacteria bacterium RIFCSPLOWO2_01_FULL_47_17]OGL88176.1 MAG: hypothetical protein A3I41_00410 [Candidatus Uhrbacteria bacterium RIFCSPLOWO2_02_FULL_48_18]